MYRVYEAIWAASPYPNPCYASVATLALFAGIGGQSWNINRAGLNQYFLVCGETGTGKDAIASGVSAIFSEIAKTLPQIEDFRGPGQIPSAPGLIKWLEKRPCTLTIIGEFGLFLKQLLNARASQHLIGVQQALLQIYSKSGEGNTLDPSAYSDREKITATIRQPSLTLVGETTPSTLYPTLTEDMIASGLLPRMAYFENTMPRPALNLNTRPPGGLVVDDLKNLAVQAISLAQRRHVHHIAIPPAASNLLMQFETYATARINAGNEITRQIWNRAYLKALKLSALPAISRSCYFPELQLSDVQWATNLIASQTDSMIAKFDRHEVGVIEGNEAKQRLDVMRVIREYATGNFDNFKQYLCDEAMHRDGVIPHSYLSRRLGTLPAFAKDRLGATTSLKRTVQRMLDDDELREMPSQQMLARYNSKAKAYIITNFAEILTKFT